MKILDRYIIKNFLTAALLWFLIFMSLRVVTDLFVNMDEFAKLLGEGRYIRTGMELASHIFNYYRWQSVVYFTELGGVIIVAAAAFSLARMNQTNELTAILASGVSLHRVVWPIVFCAMVLGGLIVLDQEWVIPSAKEYLVRDRDEVPGTKEFEVRLMSDSSGGTWYSRKFLPDGKLVDGRRTGVPYMENPAVMIRDANGLMAARLSGVDAELGSLGGQSGWFFKQGVLSRLMERGVQPWLNTPDSREVFSLITPAMILDHIAQDKEAQKKPVSAQEIEQIREGKVAIGNPDLSALKDPVYQMEIQAAEFHPVPGGAGATLVSPRFAFTGPGGGVLCLFVADRAQWKQGPGEGCWALTNGSLFYPSDLGAADMILRQSSRWVEFMSMGELTQLLKIKRVSDPESAMLTRHLRIVEPINNLVMLLLGLPFILSRERNIKASAGLCLLMVGTFYAFIYICRYMGLPPMWSAWLPILLFGPIAVVMLDSVKT